VTDKEGLYFVWRPIFPFMPKPKIPVILFRLAEEVVGALERVCIFVGIPVLSFISEPGNPCDSISFNGGAICACVAE